MADEMFPDEAALAVVARHALHDEELIAAFAVGATESDEDASRARALVERCASCRDLHADLAMIATAIKADARGPIPAPRDFRLSVEDAQRLGGRVSPRGIVAKLRRSLNSFGRPLGASLATLGLVGVLVGTVSLGGGAAGIAPQSQDSVGATAPSPGTELGGYTTPVTTTGAPVAFGPKASEGEGRTSVDGTRDLFNLDFAPSPSALLIGGSVLMLLAGLVLLLLTFRRNR